MEGATPCFLPLVRHRGGGGGARQNPPPPLPFSGVAPSTVVPGGKAIERCRGQGRSTDRSCPSTPAGQVAGPVIHEPAPTLEQVRAPVGRLDLAADLVRQGSLQDLQGTAAQRDPVLAIPLRARGRDAPHTLVAVASRAIEASVMGEGEGSGGGDGGAGGELSPVGGSKGPEPVASPNVLHWVGWLPGTTRCGAGPAVPASHGHRALLRPAALGSRRPGSRPSHP